MLALTLRREAEQGSWALVTYAEAAESEAALEGAAAELGVESAQMRRLDTQQALGSSGAMKGVMVEQRHRVDVSVAAACIAPLVEAVLCKDEAEVDAEEFRRASLVLGSLCCMDREVRPSGRLLLTMCARSDGVVLQVAAEMARSDLVYSKIWTASGNALNAVFEKDPAEMTRDDAMTVACEAIAFLVFCSQGMCANCDAAGVDEMALAVAFVQHYPLQQPARAKDEAKALRLGELALEICRNPQGLSDEELTAAWMLVAHAVWSSRTAIIALVKHGVLEAAVAHLRKSSATEWVNWGCAEGLQATAIFTMVLWVCNAADTDFPNKAERMIETGMADVIASLFKAYELRGPSKTDDASVWGLTHAMLALKELDLTSTEGRPIVQLLGGMGSALRFAVDNPLDHVRTLGLNTGSLCAVSLRTKSIVFASTHYRLADSVRAGVRKGRRRRRIWVHSGARGRCSHASQIEYDRRLGAILCDAAGLLPPPSRAPLHIRCVWLLASIGAPALTVVAPQTPTRPCWSNATP